MHTTKLRKVGGSIMLAVPPDLLDILHVRAGATVGIAIQNGRLVMELRERPRYTLEELLHNAIPGLVAARKSTNGSRTRLRAVSSSDETR